MQPILGSRGRANSPRRLAVSRPRVEVMEDRLSPGDAFFGVLMGSWWLGEALGRALTPRAPEPALTGLSSWADRLSVLPSTAFAPQLPEETAPALVTARRDDPAPEAARPADRQPIQDLRAPADAAPVAFRNHVAAAVEDAPPVTATGGAVTAPSSGLNTNTTAGFGDRATVPIGGTTMPDSPAALSFLSFVNPVAAVNQAAGQQPDTGAASPKVPEGAAQQTPPTAPVNTPDLAASCAAQPRAADPWGGDPRTIVHHPVAANGPTSCTPSGAATNQNQLPPPPDGTPDNVPVNDPGEDGTSAQDTQSETSLVAAGNDILVGFNDSTLYNGSSSPHFTGLARSGDGGSSFQDLGGLANNAAGGDAGDPALARDNVTGRVYLATLNLNASSNIDIFRSDDNFHTYLSSTLINRSGGSLDKEWMAVDNFDGAGQGNVYLIVRDFGSGSGIFLFRSSDQGNTFTPSGGVQVVAAGSGNVQGAWVTVGPDHAVYAFYYQDDNSSGLNARIMMRKSTDQGQTFGNPVTVTRLGAVGVNGDLGLVGGFRSSAFPQAVVNPVSGDLYMVFDNKGTGSDHADVFFTLSTDGGTTWATPMKVNDDTTNTSQWQPTLAVNPSGSRVAVFWYDRRNDPANDTLIDRYGAIGTVTGGSVVFDPNFRVTDTSFPVAFGRDPVVNGVYMGDYDQAVADNSYFYLTWEDNRNPSRGHTGNNQDVRFAKILQIVAGPSVVSTTPGANAFNSISSLRVTFDEQIDPDTFTPDKVVFQDPAGGSIPITDIQPVAGQNNRQFDLSFDNQTTLGAYTLTIGPDVEDVNGNPMDQNHNGIPGEDDDAYVGRITLQGPKITASTPAVGAVLTPQMVSKVTVTFNQPMNPATFTPAKIASFVGPNGDITVTGVTPVTGQNNTQFDIQFAPQAATGFYSMTIGPDIQDPAGHQMDQNGNFIDGEIPDDQFVVRFGIGGPRITTSTQLGSALPNITRSAVVTFNEAMNPSTFTTAAVSLVGPGGPVTINSITPASGNTQFTFNFNPLTVAGLYTLTVGPHVRDTFGNEMDQNNNLIPGEDPDDAFVATLGVQGPRVTSQSVSGGQVARTLTSLGVTFNEAMAPASFTVDKIVSFTRTNGTAVTDLLPTITSITPVSGNTMFNINFQSTALVGRYTLVLGPDIQDTFGNAMDQNNNLVPGEVPGDEYTATFTLLGPRITTGTQFGSTLPNTTRSLTVTFNEAMNPATFTTAAASLVGPGGPVTINSVTPLSGNMQFTINFNPLTATGLYTLTVGPHIQDTFGNEMDQNNNLIPGEDPGDVFVGTAGVQGPRVTAQTPAGVLTPQAVNSVRLTFSEAMNPASFTLDKITSFTRANGAAVTDLTGDITSVVPGSGNTQFTINFKSTALTGLYTLTVGPDIEDPFGNAMDQNGNLIPGEVPADQYVATFAIQGPRVTASTPSGVQPPQAVSSVQVVFNESMNPATFTTDQVVSFTRTNGTTVTHLEDTITSVTVVTGTTPPNSRFNINFATTGAIGAYALVLGPHVQDVFGNEMDQNGNLNPGEEPGDRYTAAFTLQGPRVTASSPTGNVLGQVNSVRVTFSEVMDPTTFTPDKISITGPGGPIDVTGIFPFGGNNAFDITFAPQVQTGRYTLVVGPDVEDYFGNEMDQNGNLVPGEVPGDQFTAIFGIQGPRVIAASAGTGLPGQVQSLRVTFNESMDPGSFTPDKIASFKGPGGVDLSVSDVQPVPFTGDTQFDVFFDPLTLAGNYSMVIGPDIEDPFGNAMDQNGNLIPGEVPADQYVATFAVQGPQVVGLARGDASGPFSTVRVTFNETIDPASFPPDRVTRFVDPAGQAIAVQDVEPVDGSDGRQFDVSFDPQTAFGTYTMVIGPGIMDPYGNTITTPFSGTVAVSPVYIASSRSFENLDIHGQSGTFSVIQYADDASVPVNLGTHTFNFYGTVYRGSTSLFASSNGLVSFGVADSAYTNTDLTAGPSEPVIAPLWSDWVKNSGTDMLEGNFDNAHNRLILQWNAIQHFNGSAQGVTFQVILYLDTGNAPGDIVFNYVNLDTGDQNQNGQTSTVGIKNTGAQGPDRALVSFDMPNPLVLGGQGILLSASQSGGAAGTPEGGRPHGHAAFATSVAPAKAGAALRAELSGDPVRGSTAASPLGFPAAFRATGVPRAGEGQTAPAAPVRTIDQVFASLRQRSALRQPARLAGADLAFIADGSDPFADLAL